MKLCKMHGDIEAAELIRDIISYTRTAEHIQIERVKNIGGATHAKNQEQGNVCMVLSTFCKLLGEGKTLSSPLPLLPRSLIIYHIRIPYHIIYGIPYQNIMSINKRLPVYSSLLSSIVHPPIFNVDTRHAI